MIDKYYFNITLTHKNNILDAKKQDKINQDLIWEIVN